MAETMEEFMKDFDFGEKLKELRKRKNVSQEQLAFDLKVSRQTVYKWEANGMQPNMESIATLCRYFGVKSDYFFDDDELTEEVAAAADNGGEAQAQAQAETKGKGKDKRFIICLCIMVVCSVLFAVLTFVTVRMGFSAFDSNAGYVVVTDFEDAKTIFALSLVGSIISLGAGVIAIFFLKKFKM